MTPTTLFPDRRFRLAMLPAAVAGLVVTSAPSCSSNSASGPDGGAFAAFSSRIEDLRDESNIPSVSGLVLRDDDVIWEEQFGRRNIDAARDATVGTIFHLASLTKPVAAAVTMQLVQEGKLQLEQPVSDFGINMASQGTVRVWHLMSHTSEGVPGSSFYYNGNRFGALDVVLQNVTGQSFATLFDQRIRRPLQLTQTSPDPRNGPAFSVTGLSTSEISDSIAQGYRFLQARRNVAIPYQSHFGTAAGLLSTPREYVRFIRALDGTSLINDQSRTRMFAPIVTPAGDTLPYALGWFSQRYKGQMINWHYGLWDGTSTLVIRVPDKHLIFVLFANNEMLSAPFNLGAGDILKSPFAVAFLSQFVDQ